MKIQNITFSFALFCICPYYFSLISSIYFVNFLLLTVHKKWYLYIFHTWWWATSHHVEKQFVCVWQNYHPIHFRLRLARSNSAFISNSLKNLWVQQEQHFRGGQNNTVVLLQLDLIIGNELVVILSLEYITPKEDDQIVLFPPPPFFVQAALN